jgi:hypothetical protein
MKARGRRRWSAEAAFDAALGLKSKWPGRARPLQISMKKR